MVAVQRVDHQVQQLPHLGLEAQRFLGVAGVGRGRHGVSWGLEGARVLGDGAPGNRRCNRSAHLGRAARFSRPRRVSAMMAAARTRFRCRGPRADPRSLVTAPDAHQLRRLPERPQARRHPVEDISEYVSRPTASSGWRCSSRDASELDEMAEEFGLHELAVEDAQRRPPAAQDRGVRRLAVRRAAHHRARAPPTDGRLRSSARSTSSSGRNYVLSVRHRTHDGFADVRARCEREPELLRHGAGLRALRADGRRRRPLLPGARRARGRARADRGADLRAARRARPTSRRSTRSSSS